MPSISILDILCSFSLFSATFFSDCNLDIFALIWFNFASALHFSLCAFFCLKFSSETLSLAVCTSFLNCSTFLVCAIFLLCRSFTFARTNCNAFSLSFFFCRTTSSLAFICTMLSPDTAFFDSPTFLLICIFKHFSSAKLFSLSAAFFMFDRPSALLSICFFSCANLLRMACSDLFFSFCSSDLCSASLRAFSSASLFCRCWASRLQFSSICLCFSISCLCRSALSRAVLSSGVSGKFST